MRASPLIVHLAFSHALNYCAQTDSDWVGSMLRNSRYIIASLFPVGERRPLKRFTPPRKLNGGSESGESSDYSDSDEYSDSEYSDSDSYT